MSCAPIYVASVVVTPDVAMVTIGPLEVNSQPCAGRWTIFDLTFTVPSAPTGNVYSLGTVHPPTLSMMVDKLPHGTGRNYDEALLGWYPAVTTFDPTPYTPPGCAAFGRWCEAVFYGLPAPPCNSIAPPGLDFWHGCGCNNSRGRCRGVWGCDNGAYCESRFPGLDLLLNAATGGTLTYRMAAFLYFDVGVPAFPPGVWDLSDILLTLQYFPPVSGCSYAISPLTNHFAWPGGDGLVSVLTTSGCPWTAASNATWLHLTSGFSGVGPGSVTYHCDENDAPGSRTGTLSIAGQTHTVTQDGRPGRGPCPHCPDCGRVLSGHCSAFCANEGFRSEVHAGGYWEIVLDPGTPGEALVATSLTATGFSVTQTGDCQLQVCAPCSNLPKGTLTHYAVTYWRGTQAVDPATGTRRDQVLTNCFDLVADLLCPDMPPPPPSGDGGPASCVEIDSPRQWLHLGRGATIATYSLQDYHLFFKSAPYSVDRWLKLRHDSRQHGGLAMLGVNSRTLSAPGVLPAVVQKTYSVWTSGDGGQTGEVKGSQVATSALLERASELGYLIWFYSEAGTSEGIGGQVWRKLSKDFGQTWDAPVAVTDDREKPLRALLIDSVQEGRGGVIALICQVGSDAPKVYLSSDSGESFTPAALT